eukprot:g28861.t1
MVHGDGFDIENRDDGDGAPCPYPKCTGRLYLMDTRVYEKTIRTYKCTIGHPRRDHLYYRYDDGPFIP